MRSCLGCLNARLDPVNHDEWLAHIDRMKDMYPLRYDKDVLSGPYVIEKLYEVTDGDAVISTDVGQHQMWTAQYYKFKQPRQLLTCLLYTSCPACRSYSRAYIRHLLKAKEMLGMRLCVLHNLYFYNTMMKEIRDAIEEHRYAEYKERKLSGMAAGETK